MSKLSSSANLAEAALKELSNDALAWIPVSIHLDRYLHCHQQAGGSVSAADAIDEGS